MNLIDPQKWYYHPRLRSMPGPPVTHILPNGQIIYLNDTGWFCHTISEFTLDDLLAYYEEQIGEALYVPRDRAIFNALLRRFDVDLLLFAIDLAAGCLDGMDRRPENAWFIESYTQDARRAMDSKMTEELQAGVVPVG
jgi:hypothetical protein